MIYDNIKPTANNYSLENQLLEQSQNGDFFKDTPKVVKKKTGFLILLFLVTVSTFGLLLLASGSLDIRGKAANTGSKISLAPATKSVILGEEFLISIVLNTGPDEVSAVDLKISYDPTAVTLTEFSTKDVFPHFLSPFKESAPPGLISAVLAADPGKPFIGNTIIGSFKVKVINPKRSDILFTTNTMASAKGKQTDSLIQKTGTVLSATTGVVKPNIVNNIENQGSIIKSAVTNLKTVTLSNSSPSIINTSLVSGTKGASYSENIEITKSNKKSSPSVTISGLPFGLNKANCVESVGSLSLNCAILGIPTQSGLYGILVRVEEPNQPIIEKTLPLQIK